MTRWQYWRYLKFQAGLCTHCGKSATVEGYSRCRWCLTKRANGARALQKHKQAPSLRLRAMYSLGARCECCGERDLVFLTFDHKNNDGRKDRRKTGQGTGFYWQIIRGKRPDIRILCFNCNCGREKNGGICPHEKRRSETGSGDSLHVQALREGLAVAFAGEAYGLR